MFQLYAAIWRVSGPRQVILIILSIAIAALAAAPLKFQQEIVNHLAENGAELATLTQLGLGMMGVIVLSLCLKWLLGYRSGLLGEDVIRTIRNRLVSGAAEMKRDDKSMSSGTLSTAISAEAEELGRFAGSAFSDPVVQIGTLISVIGFVAATQPRLGLVALAMLAPQIILVLATQRRVNVLVADRVKVLRAASNKVTSEDIREAEQSILRDFDEIFEVRRSIFKWKLSTKFILSLVNGGGKVTVLMLGGWLVLRGQSDLGTLVAATFALDRLQGPTAFLIAFYRQVSANRVKFDLLRGLAGVVDPERAAPAR